MRDDDPLLDLTGNTRLLARLQLMIDDLYDSGDLNALGDNPEPVDNALQVLAANGGDPLLSEDLVMPIRRYAGNEAMRQAIVELEAYLASSPGVIAA